MQLNIKLEQGSQTQSDSRAASKIKNQCIWKISKMTQSFLKYLLFSLCSRAALNPLASRVFETPVLEAYRITTQTF